jgi:hypothetical protein
MWHDEVYGDRVGASAFADDDDAAAAAVVVVAAAIHCNARDRQCRHHSGNVQRVLARTTRVGVILVGVDNCCSWIEEPKNRFGSLILRRMEDMSLLEILLERYELDV